jgi:hypothetical protein
VLREETVAARKMTDRELAAAVLDACHAALMQLTPLQRAMCDEAFVRLLGNGTDNTERLS